MCLELKRENGKGNEEKPKYFVVNDNSTSCESNLFIHSMITRKQPPRSKNIDKERRFSGSRQNFHSSLQKHVHAIPLFIFPVIFSTDGAKFSNARQRQRSYRH